MFSHQSWNIWFITNQNVPIPYSFIYLTKFLEIVCFSAVLSENKICFITIIKLLCVQFLPTTLPADWRDVAATHVWGRKPWVSMKTSAPPTFWVLKSGRRTPGSETKQKHDTGMDSLSLIPVMQPPYFTLAMLNQSPGSYSSLVSQKRPNNSAHSQSLHHARNV